MAIVKTDAIMIEYKSFDILNGLTRIIIGSEKNSKIGQIFVAPSREWNLTPSINKFNGNNIILLKLNG